MVAPLETYSKDPEPAMRRHVERMQPADEILSDFPGSRVTMREER